MGQWLVAHLHEHYALYGELTGVRSARKHIGWAVHSLPGGDAFRAVMNRLETTGPQIAAVTDYFDRLAELHPRLPPAQTDPHADTRAAEHAATHTAAPAATQAATQASHPAANDDLLRRDA